MGEIIIIGAACGLGAKNRSTELGPAFLNKSFKQEKSKLKCKPILKAIGELTKKREDSVSCLGPFYKRLATKTSNIVRKGNFPIVIGGDHSVAIGTWSGIITARKAEGKFGLIWIDAHMDAHTFETSPSKSIHGMPVAALLGAGEKEFTKLGSIKNKVSPEHLVLIGIRSYEKEEEEFLQRLGVRIFYIEEVKLKGFAKVFGEAIKIASNQTKAFGISLDIDAFDPEFAPGTGTAVEQGLSPAEFLKAIKGIARHKHLAGLEIVEYNPLLDVGNKTGTLLKKIIEQILK